MLLIRWLPDKLPRKSGRPEGPQQDQIVLHWVEELRRLVPSKIDPRR